MNRLKTVMKLLIENDAPLSKEWRDHELIGKWADYRECHVKGDLLIIYQLRPGCVIFVRAGTHSKLFRK